MLFAVVAQDHNINKPDSYAGWSKDIPAGYVINVLTLNNCLRFLITLVRCLEVLKKLFWRRGVSLDNEVPHQRQVQHCWTSCLQRMLLKLTTSDCNLIWSQFLQERALRPRGSSPVPGTELLGTPALYDCTVDKADDLGSDTMYLMLIGLIFFKGKNAFRCRSP